ncbi:MAG: lysophospholipid acyltransferase family protein [Gemmatimonadaceae bacterium]
MRTLLVAINFLLVTPVVAAMIIAAALAGDGPRSQRIIERCGRFWARSACRAAGVRIRVHNPERLLHNGARIFVSNHVSWFDIFALASVLPRYTFVAKAELAGIPIFGPAARAFGIIFIERSNRRAAFDSYRAAGHHVERGKSVVVCPEGTRGRSYELRPFKKGPFVFAISSGAPIVPTIVHGAMQVQRAGSPWIRAGTVDIHLLEPVETAGYTYDERDQLVRAVWKRMALELHEVYGIESHIGAIDSSRDRGETPASLR